MVCCATRRGPSRIAPPGPEVTERAVTLALEDQPGETTHSLHDMMAEAADISATAVRRIWKAPGIHLRKPAD